MGMMIFAFAVIFGVLSGWIGALAVARMRGVVAVVLGVVVSALAMVVFMGVQVGLLNLLGGSKTMDEVLLSTVVLAGALCFIWGPAFGVFYWRTPRVIL
jgi:hypothetical protein